MKWSFGLLTFVILLADVRAQTPCSMTSTITVTLEEGNVTANQALDSTSPYQASLPVTGTLGGPNGITLIMTSENPLAPNPNNIFSIENFGTGTRIPLINSVDRDGPGSTNLDDTEIISFQLKCTSNADATTTAYATVNVNIRDVNDNSPQFINTPYLLSVEEFTPVGTTIYRQISALDKDSGLAAFIDYTISAGDGSVMDGSRKFLFTSTRFPNLIISQSLDFETMYALGQTTYVMNVIAKDLGTPPLSSVTQVNVTITDSDDMAPAFVYANCLLSGIYCVDPRYSTSVVSGQITNPLTIYPLVGFSRQTATAIRAVDRDTLRSPLTFRIVGTSPIGYETYFSVAGSGPVSSGDKDIYTATLTQLQMITKSSTLTRVEVYILATQANLKYEERATVSVEIDVPNNSPPTVSTATGLNTGYIYENSHLGQNVLDGTTSSAKPLQLIVTDPDDSISGQKTTFSFSATGTGLFNVDSNGYIYMASGNLDYETTKSATINVRVTETNTAERRFTDVTVTILVLDLNDNDPVFTSTGAVHVSVPEGDYALSSRLLAQLSVHATDGGGMIGTATVRVNIKRDSATLAFTSLNYNGQVPENNAVGFSILTVTATPEVADLTYQITGLSDGPQFFRVEPTGQIRINRSLTEDIARRQFFELRVEATGTLEITRQTATATVIIEVLRNVNGPIFTPNQYIVNISETQRIGSSVVQTTARDADNDTLIFEIVQNPGATDFFYIYRTSGLIILNQAINTEKTPQYQFTIIARDQRQNEKTGTAMVTVIVQRNNFSPVFQAVNGDIPPYGAAINFDQPLNTPFFKAVATDQDNPPLIKYEITGYLSGPSYFEITTNTGDIFVRADLRNGIETVYTLGLIAYDANLPTDTAVTNISITVNRNPNAPGFNPLSYSRTINENYDVGVSLVQINASDPDGNSLTYTIENSNPPGAQNYFFIYPNNGLLVVTRSLTQAPANSYTIYVRVSDNGIPNRPSVSLAEVLINIDRNQFSPIFIGPYTSNVQEDAPFEFSVLTVRATDNDPPGPYSAITYQMIGDDQAPTYFKVNDTTGEIRVHSSLIATNSLQYVARIVARDGGIPSRSATTTVLLNILRNLQKPVFNLTNYNTTILETLAADTVVLTVTATDNDRLSPQNEVTYSWTDITGNGQGQIYFSLNADTGAVSVRRQLYDDNFNTPTYRFTIIASDGGTPAQTSDIVANVVISVDRNLFAPEFQNEQTYNVQVPFTTGSNVEVNNRILATDTDSRAPFNTVTYSIIGDGNATNFFSINPALGTITTRTSLVTTNSNTYTIRIVATDGGTPSLSDTATAMVSINRNLNDPAWSQVAYSVVIQETRVYGDIILTLAASDSDTSAPYNTLQYTMTGEADTSNYFGVDSAGRIFVKQSLLNSGKNTYIAFISLQDGGSPPRSAITQANVTITIIRNNFAPVITNTVFFATLQLNFGVGTQVYTVTAQDQDPANTPFGTVRFRIIGDDDAVRLFSIDSVSGLITIARDLSTTNTTADQFRIRVEAYDLGSPSKSDSKVVVVTVRSNFNTPSILPNSYIQTIYETRDLGDVILDINATDADPLAPNNVLDYKITGDASSQQCFQINQKTGEISLKLSLLFQPCRNDSYTMTVVASDQGVPVLFSPPATVRINVIRNRSPPTFINLDNVTSISETQPINVNIFQAIATDPDQPPFNQITYAAIGDDLSTTIFSVNPSTGAVQLTRSVLNELATQYTLRIEARDSGAIPLLTSAKLMINISHNLNRPVFAQLNYNTTILETQGVGLSFFQISASDADTKAPYNTITFRSVSGATNYFDVVSVGNNGQLIVTRSLTLDTLRTPQYTLQVSVTDGGGLTSQQFAIITINVLRNLNCPVFSTLPTDISISQSVGSRQLYGVNATDADALGTVFSDITYTLIGDDQAPTYFSMDRLTGVVTSSSALFSHNGVSYTLRITAADSGSPPCITSSTLTIRVNRNLNSPVWQNAVNNVFTTRIREDLDLSFAVITVQASDADDRSPYNVVRYSLDASSLYQSLFYVDAVTGQVFLRASLVGRSETSYTLKLLATDMGTPALSSPIADLVINMDRNNFPPEILNLPDTVGVSENLFAGILVLQILARDNDTVGPFATLEYTIIGDDSSSLYFSIDSAGVIRLVRSLLNQATTVYKVRVRVRDGGIPPKETTTILTVNVHRNLFSPSFLLPSYITTIQEVLPVGSYISNVSATDADRQAPYNTVMYAFVMDDDLFDIDRNTGRITVQSSLLGRTQNSYQYQIYAYDGGNPSQKSNNISVTINIIRNQFPPEILNLPSQINITSSYLENNLVFTVQYRDNDTQAPFNTISTEIVGVVPTSDLFKINPVVANQASILMNRNANTGTQMNYYIWIRARDGGSPSKTIEALLKVIVTSNCQPPTFPPVDPDNNPDQR